MNRRVSEIAEVRIGRAGIAQLARFALGGDDLDLPDSEILPIHGNEYGGFGVDCEDGLRTAARSFAAGWLAAQDIPEGTDVMSPGHVAHAMARLLVDAIDDTVLLTQPPPPLTAAERYTPPGVYR